MKRIQRRRSFDAHVEVLNSACSAPYFFNVVSKVSTWQVPATLFDWTVIIELGTLTFRNRVNHTVSEHVPITLQQILAEDLEQLRSLPSEPPPTAAVPERVVAPAARETTDHTSNSGVSPSDWQSYLDEKSGSYYWYA